MKKIKKMANIDVIQNIYAGKLWGEAMAIAKIISILIFKFIYFVDLFYIQLHI